MLVELGKQDWIDQRASNCWVYERQQFFLCWQTPALYCERSTGFPSVSHA